MLKGWLRGQLTKAKQQAPMWTELMDAIQEILELHVEEYITRLEKRVSLFDADKRDLTVLLRELGDFFALGEVHEDDLAIAIMQRQDQIHQKKTVYPLINTFVREFQGLEVTWEPLYAPVDQDLHKYGDKLLAYREIAGSGIPESDWFMTSRGVIRVPLNQVNRIYGGVDTFESILKRVVYPLIPLKIVCDGQQYFLSFDLIELKEYMEFQSSVTTSMTIEDLTSIHQDSTIQINAEIPVSHRDEFEYPARTRFDAIRVDAITLDRHEYQQAVLTFSSESDKLIFNDLNFTNR